MNDIDPNSKNAPPAARQKGKVLPQRVYTTVVYTASKLGQPEAAGGEGAESDLAFSKKQAIGVEACGMWP